MQSLRAAKVWLASFVALLVASAQLGGAVHQSTVQHTVCAEHGEVVDVPGGPVVAAAERTSVAAAHEPHGHEHCAVHALVARGSGQDAPLATRSPRHAAVAHLAAYAPPRAIAILALAPKSSPPV